jgi:hypothetical protein
MRNRGYRRTSFAPFAFPRGGDCMRAPPQTGHTHLRRLWNDRFSSRIFTPQSLQYTVALLVKANAPAGSHEDPGGSGPRSLMWPALASLPERMRRHAAAPRMRLFFWGVRFRRQNAPR